MAGAAADVTGVCCAALSDALGRRVCVGDTGAGALELEGVEAGAGPDEL